MKERHHNSGRFVRRDFVYLAWVVACAAPAFLIGWSIYVNSIPSRIRARHDVLLASIPRAEVADPSALPIAVEGAWGDIFDPNAGNTERAYNVVVISATLDPVSQVGEVITWQSNRLVREALRQAAQDPTLADTMVNSVIAQMMTSNKLFIDRITRAPIDRLDDPYTASLCNPLFSRVPSESTLGRKGIRLLAVVPLFKPDLNTSGETKQRLRYNVRIGVGRVMNELNLREKRDGDYKVFGVALPALAGTEGRLDSGDFLTYRESFQEIIRGVMGRQLPSALEGVYFVAWDQLANENPREGLAAVEALASVYSSVAMNTYVPAFLGNLIVLSFCAAFVIGWLREPNASKRHVAGAAVAALTVWLVVDFADKYVKATAVLRDVIGWTGENSGTIIVVLLTSLLSFVATAAGLRIAAQIAHAETDEGKLKPK